VNPASNPREVPTRRAFRGGVDRQPILGVANERRALDRLLSRGIVGGGDGI